ncbi:MAG TPA: SIS domain-containing protein [Solirubrobacteraceae bacterium]|nr:SIS domain-containing protein [Solirubrobacteraceae bacterium]
MNPDRFMDDILAEPETLERVLAGYAGPGSPLVALGSDPLQGRRVVLIGMGSSRFAALTVAGLLRVRGITAVAEYASTDTPVMPAADVLAIGISASGTTEETVQALARHCGTSRTIAVTNAPDARLREVADHVLPLLAGREHGGVACRTFQATLAVLLRLAGAAHEELVPAVAAQAALLDRRDEWLAPLTAMLEGAHAINTVAPAARLSSALQSALMLREGPRIPAYGAETGDWLHVDVYLSKYPGYLAVLFGGSRYDEGLMEWARERGSTVVAVGRPVQDAALHISFDRPDDPYVCTLVETSVVELAAADWWRRRLQAGAMP